MFLILLHRQEEDFWSSLSRILERISTREVVSSRLIRYTLRFVSYLPLERSLNFSSVDLFSFAFYITNKSWRFRYRNVNHTFLRVVPKLELSTVWLFIPGLLSHLRQTQTYQTTEML